MLFHVVQEGERTLQLQWSPQMVLLQDLVSMEDVAKISQRKETRGRLPVMLMYGASSIISFFLILCYPVIQLLEYFPLVKSVLDFVNGPKVEYFACVVDI